MEKLVTFSNASHKELSRNVTRIGVALETSLHDRSETKNLRGEIAKDLRELQSSVCRLVVIGETNAQDRINDNRVL